jgi:hypothetical protein
LAALYPDWRHGGGFQRHHIIPRSQAIEHWPLNLIRLCLLCHPARVHDQALVTMEDLWAARRYTVWELLYLWLIGELARHTGQQAVYPDVVARSEWAINRLQSNPRLWRRVQCEAEQVQESGLYRLEAVVEGLERPWVDRLHKTMVTKPTPPWVTATLEGLA